MITKDLNMNIHHEGDKVNRSDVRITRVENLDGPLTKSFTYQNGLLKKSASADLVNGASTVIRISNIYELSDVIDGLSSNQALTYGTPDICSARVTTQKRLPMMKGRSVPYIARDADHFHWPVGRGVFMGDIDRAKDGSQPMKAFQLDELLCDILPWWSAIARFYRPSASAFVYSPDGETRLTEPGSLRCYAICDNAEYIPFVGIAVLDALWKAGYGRIEFSAAGSLLLRCPFDSSVWQGERLDFAGPPVLHDGLTQRKFKPLFYPGADIDTEAAISAGPGKITQTEWRKGSAAVRRAQVAARPEEQKRRVAYVDKRSAADIRAGADPEAVKRRRMAALSNGALSPTDEILFADGTSATVAAILESPARYDRMRCADPEDSSYANDRRIAVLYANDGWPRIFSHAHGGTSWKLGRGRAA
jgi:hypothetical protein